jgi:hypothetical protein
LQQRLCHRAAGESEQRAQARVDLVATRKRKVDDRTLLRGEHSRTRLYVEPRHRPLVHAV